jgi:hypothetical protein
MLSGNATWTSLTGEFVMIEILKSSWVAVVDLLTLVWSVLGVLTGWVWDVLYHIHVSAPRLEGLLIGVALAWVMLRRDKHPLLRVFSAPLKLIVDILDLAWDQVVEVIDDVAGTAKEWTVRPLKWLWYLVTDTYDWVMDKLRSLRDMLSRRDD